MAVLTFDEIHDGREGGAELVSKRSTVVRHVRVFRVVTDSNTTDENTIAQHASCPDIGDVHPNDTDSYVRSVRFENQTFSKKVWVVTAEYTDEYELSTNPILEPAEITWSSQTFQRPYWADRNGQGITNSAGDIYDPPVMGDDARWTATITKNVPFVPTWVLTYRNAVNSAAFALDGLAIPVGAAKMMGMTISKWEKRSIFEYRTLSFSIAIDSAGWAVSVLDVGFRKIVSTTKRENARNDGDFESIVHPVLLDGSGGVLVNPSPSNAVFRTFNIYPSKDFSVLPLS